MDNRITKKRLYDFLSYEWIVIIIVSAIAIVAAELLSTFVSVRTTAGQRFDYFYDENVLSLEDSAFYENLNGVFSYDVREIKGETLTSDYNVLSIRLTTGDGDVIFTDTYEAVESGGKTYARAKAIIDGYRIFTFGDESDEESLLYYAVKYLSGFLKEGETDPTVYDNLDQSKIERNFNFRATDRIYKNDLRAGKLSLKDEYERIKKLCEDVSYFKKIIDYDKSLGENSIFYSYKKGEQFVLNGGEKPDGYDARVSKKYGLNLSKLGEKAKNAFSLRDRGKEGDVVALAFDFRTGIPDLQYETISFINCVVKNYADFADSL